MADKEKDELDAMLASWYGGEQEPAYPVEAPPEEAPWWLRLARRVSGAAPAGVLPISAPMAAAGPIAELIHNEMTRDPAWRAEMLPVGQFLNGEYGYTLPRLVSGSAEALDAFGKAGELVFDPDNTAGYTQAEVEATPQRVMDLTSWIGPGGLLASRPAGALASGAARIEDDFVAHSLDEAPFDLPNAAPFAGGDMPFDLPSAPGIRSTKPSEVAAPNINRGELFDYGMHDDIAPNNPLGLPPQDYYKSPQKMRPGSDAEKIAELANSRKVQNAVNKAVERGISGDDRNAVLNWYNNEPLRERFHDLYKGDDPDAAFLQLMQATGTTSPMNSVSPNISEASRIYKYLQQGKEIPRVGKDAGLGGIAADTKAILSRKKFGQEPGYNVKDAQKPEHFGRSLAGDQSKVVVDTHAVRGLSMPTGDPRYLRSGVRYKDPASGAYRTYSPADLLDSGEVSMKQMLESSGDWLSAPPDAVYGLAAKPYEKAAKKFDLAPGQAQAAAWYANAGMTGVKTEPLTFLQLFEQRLRDNAEALGTELSGQNMWVNYGPHGEHNRKASGADTIFGEQKVGEWPEWAIEAGDLSVTREEAIQRGIIDKALRLARGFFKGGKVEDPELSKTPGERQMEREQRNHHLNQKFFQPPFLTLETSPEETQRMHDWMRGLYDDGASNEDVRDEFWRMKDPPP